MSYELAPDFSPPSTALVAEIVARALAEDRAYHDVTSRALIPPGQRGHGRFYMKAAGVVCGLNAVEPRLNSRQFALGHWWHSELGLGCCVDPDYPTGHWLYLSADGDV